MASVEMTCLDQASHSRKASSVVGTDCIVDIENVVDEVRISFEITERDCRICMLGLDAEFGIAIDLGCSCKNELAAVHLPCAQQWFICKGNNVCEVCHSIAQNVVIPCEFESRHQSSQVNPSSTNAVSEPVSQFNTSSTNAILVSVSSTDTVVFPRASPDTGALPRSSRNAARRLCASLIDVVCWLLIFIFILELVGWIYRRVAN